MQLRRVEGPKGVELFCALAPPSAVETAEGQGEALYHALGEVLAREGASFQDVVSERLFFRHLERDLQSVRSARARVLIARLGHDRSTPSTEIEQPPLEAGARIELAVQAIRVAPGASRRAAVFDSDSVERPKGWPTHATRVSLDGELRLYTGALHGEGTGAYAQTLSMFESAEELLRRAGMDFADVARTWIHLREMDRDYAEFNRARRTFFEARGVAPLPASTGIGGGPSPSSRDLCLSLYAVRGEGTQEKVAMTSPTLNEAPEYGADFARGLRMVEANKVALHVSGTASVDESGKTAHEGDFDAQVERMLVNVEALLRGEGATFADVVSAITYVKNAKDADRLRERMRAVGYQGFPHVLAEARVCRPDLLCETEALAVLPHRFAGPRPGLT